MSDHLVTQQEPRLEHLGYHVLPKVLIIDVHNGVVLFRVKWLALGLDLRDSQLLQDLLVLVEDHLQPLLVGRVLIALSGHSPLQVVVHRQELLDGVRLGVLVEIVFLLRGALAVVVVLCRQPDELILHGLQLPGGQLRRLHLLPGQGVGLFLFLLAPGGLLRLLIGHLLLRGGSLFLRSLLRLFRRLLRRLLRLFAHSFASSFGGNSCLPNSRVNPSAKPESRAATVP